MPKVTGPLFSVEAHGALADAIIYQRRPGGASVYGYKKPKVPLTDRQVWQRDLIKWGVYEWQQLSDEEKEDWEDKAQGQRQSGYSFFLKQRKGYLFDPDVALYLPLYDARLNVSSFLSLESYAHTCLVTGAIWTSQGREFDGEDDFINCGHAASLDPIAITISLWVKLALATPPHNLYLVCKQDPWALYQYTGSKAINTWIKVGGVDYGDVGIAAGDVEVGVFYYVALTYDQETIKIYLNGVLKDSDTTPSGPINSYPNNNVILGGFSGANYPFDGTIGEVLIYNRALSIDEIVHNYLATKWRY